MNLAQSARGRLVAALLSAAVAVLYAVIAFAPPSGFESPPTPVMALAAASYLVGSVVIPRVERRWLLIGAIANLAVVSLFAISAARGLSTVDALSLGGKALQVLLSAQLVMLWRR